MNSNCRELICCHSKDGSGSSGLFGEYTCDTPVIALTEMLDSVKTQFTPDIVMITGGIIARDLTLTQAQVLTSMTATFTTIKAKFPAAQIYFSLGEEEFGPSF